MTYQYIRCRLSGEYLTVTWRLADRRVWGWWRGRVELGESMSEAKLKAIADKTAKYLMTSGRPGPPIIAARLALMSNDSKDMGGWGFNPLRDVILSALKEATKPKPKGRV